jgi:hypothetical protein
MRQADIGADYDIRPVCPNRLDDFVPIGLVHRSAADQRLHAGGQCILPAVKPLMEHTALLFD